MKAYTDLEQSKKLTEILPVESADAWWAERYRGKVTHDGQYIVNEEPIYYISFIKPSEINYSQDTVKDIPCWSLAALLSVFSLPRLMLDEQEDGERGWFVSHYTDDYRYDSYYRDEPIDACYELILQLKEKNLL